MLPEARVVLLLGLEVPPLAVAVKVPAVLERTPVGEDEVRPQVGHHRPELAEGRGGAGGLEGGSGGRGRRGRGPAGDGTPGSRGGGRGPPGSGHLGPGEPVVVNSGGDGLAGLGGVGTGSRGVLSGSERPGGSCRPVVVVVDPGVGVDPVGVASGEACAEAGVWRGGRGGGRGKGGWVVQEVELIGGEVELEAEELLAEGGGGEAEKDEKGEFEESIA